LGTAVRFVLNERVRDQIVAETRGNPLALLELPRGLTSAQLAVGFGLVDGRALPGRIEASFTRRLEALPEDTQVLLVLAAAEPGGDPALLWRAAQRLGIEPRAADRAESEGLLMIGERVIFRHPLVRSAVYRSAAIEDRRAAHLALAEVTDRELDPDRRAWHLAAATAGPDEEVAAELERSADRAQARGGMAAAAAFLNRSVALTVDPGRRAERALAAAQAHLRVGALDEALRLLAVAESDAQSEAQHALIELVRAQIASAGGPRSEASAQLLSAARRLEPLDIDLARETYLDAWAAAKYAGQRDMLHNVSQAARGALSSSKPQRIPDLLLNGYSLLVTEGRPAAIPALREAVGAFPTEELSVEKGLRWGALAAAAAGTLWDFESMEAVMSRQSQLARNAGALVPLCFTLTGDVFVLAWRGELAAATNLAAETDSLMDAIGVLQAPMGAVLLEALRGDEPHSSTFIEAATKLATVRGEAMASQVGQWANAILLNGLARYEEAMSLSVQATEGPTDHLVAWALPELIEAAVGTGAETLAVDAVQRLAGSANTSETDWGRGIFARSRALVSRGEVAERQYRESIESLGRTVLRPEQARSHLLYGEWLRRENRQVDAGPQLLAAHEQFTTIGMKAFAERARTELLAMGGKARKRRIETREDLTAQERHIAELARDGLSSREIAARLFLSPRTVEWHLRKVFGKLGIHSRRELANALSEASTRDLPTERR
jgi:DNA-binding CsgD family transcriptional regulator